MLVVVLVVVTSALSAARPDRSITQEIFPTSLLPVGVANVEGVAKEKDSLLAVVIGTLVGIELVGSENCHGLASIELANSAVSFPLRISRGVDDGWTLGVVAIALSLAVGLVVFCRLLPFDAPLSLFTLDAPLSAVSLGRMDT